LLRQYFPKGTDLSVWTGDHLERVAAELNDRPRACLQDKSPHQLMQQWEHRLITTIIRNDR
jgi:IS30 family transposase